MDNSEMILLWVVFIWIWISSFLFSYMEDRIIKKVKFILGEKANEIGKNTFLNPIQNFRNMLFFFRYNVDASDPKVVAMLIRRGKYLNILYFTQLACIGIFMAKFIETIAFK